MYWKRAAAVGCRRRSRSPANAASTCCLPRRSQPPRTWLPVDHRAPRCPGDRDAAAARSVRRSRSPSVRPASAALQPSAASLSTLNTNKQRRRVTAASRATNDVDHHARCSTERSQTDRRRTARKKLPLNEKRIREKTRRLKNRRKVVRKSIEVRRQFMFNSK